MSITNMVKNLFVLTRNWHLNFLVIGQVVALIGNTLFAHAHIDKQSIGFIPGRNQIDYRTDGYYLKNDDPQTRVQTWVKALNEWAQTEIQDWIANPFWNQSRTKRGGGSSLMDYPYTSMPNKPARKESVICNKYMEGSTVEVPDDELNTILRTSGVNRVVVGHSPVSFHFSK